MLPILADLHKDHPEPQYGKLWKKLQMRINNKKLEVNESLSPVTIHNAINACAGRQIFVVMVLLGMAY